MIFAHTALTNLDVEMMRERVEQQVRLHKSRLVFLGFLSIAAGGAAATLPGLAALNTEIIAGAVLLAAGIFQAVLIFKTRANWWLLLPSLLSSLAGGFILWRPMYVFLAFVTALAVFMTIEGLFQIYLALRLRPVRSWTWMLVSGAVTLLFAFMIWIGYPAFDVLYLGWIVAANLMLYGVSLLALVWRATISTAEAGKATGPRMNATGGNVP